MAIKLFLSHSAKDKDLAKALIHLFQCCLKLKDDEIRCSSVVPYNLDAGANTDATLREELRTCGLVIGLLSRESSDSYYVLAELGARWGLGGPLMVVRSSNFSLTQLSGPLANLTIPSIDSNDLLLKHCRQAAGYLNVAFSPSRELTVKCTKVIKLNKELASTPFELNSVQWNGAIYNTRSQVYKEIAATLDSLSKTQDLKELVLGALHGHSDATKRKHDDADIQTEVAAFDAAMQRCILASCNKWKVRHIYNVTNVERLRVIEARLQRTKNAEGFEVKAFCHPGSLPHLAPLVAGAEDVFLSVEGPDRYRVESAIHIKNRSVAVFVTKYLEKLWTRPDTFHLMQPDGVNTDEISRLRNEIRRTR